MMAAYALRPLLFASTYTHSSSHANQPSTTYTRNFCQPPLTNGPSPPHLFDASLPMTLSPTAARALAASVAPTPYESHQQNTRLGSPDNKPGLEEHQKTVAPVASWLDLRVLKALGEEAGDRRVDAYMIMLAVNDTNVRRF